MICATVVAPNDSTSLRTVIETATPGQIPANFSGRVAAIHLQWVNNTTVITWLAGDPGTFETTFHRLQSDRQQLILLAPTGNQLSIDEIFVEGNGSILRVIAFSI